MRLRAFLACVAVCAPASAAQFSFGAFGDTPYNALEEPQFVAIIAEMNRQPLAFAIHVGDFKDSGAECSDALFLQRRDTFQLSHHPFFFTPGDNEWQDCRRARFAPHDPLERLARLRELFFSAPLGQRTITTADQRAQGYPENVRWLVQDVAFATLNIPGSNNDEHTPAESKPRTKAVLEWMHEAFRTARERKLPAVVLATQGNLFTGASGYAAFVSTLVAEAQRYDGQVLVVHGDTHLFHFDQPLVDPKSGRPVTNVTRLEVFGSPFVDWVQVTVNTDGGRAKFSVRRGSDVAAQKQ